MGTYEYILTIRHWELQYKVLKSPHVKSARFFTSELLSWWNDKNEIPFFGTLQPTVEHTKAFLVETMFLSNRQLHAKAFLVKEAE